MHNKTLEECGIVVTKGSPAVQHSDLQPKLLAWLVSISFIDWQTRGLLSLLFLLLLLRDNPAR